MRAFRLNIHSKLKQFRVMLWGLTALLLAYLFVDSCCRSSPAPATVGRQTLDALVLEEVMQFPWQACHHLAKSSARIPSESHLRSNPNPRRTCSEAIHGSNLGPNKTPARFLASLVAHLLLHVGYPSICTIIWLRPSWLLCM